MLQAGAQCSVEFFPFRIKEGQSYSAVWQRPLQWLDGFLQPKFLSHKSAKTRQEKHSSTHRLLSTWLYSQRISEFLSSLWWLINEWLIKLLVCLVQDYAAEKQLLYFKYYSFSYISKSVPSKNKISIMSLILFHLVFNKWGSRERVKLVCIF